MPGQAGASLGRTLTHVDPMPVVRCYASFSKHPKRRHEQYRGPGLSVVQHLALIAVVVPNHGVKRRDGAIGNDYTVPPASRLGLA
jgi:hypothetical protein